MSLDKIDWDMIKTELELIQNKLDFMNENISMIQKTTYQMLLEQVKTNTFLELLVESENNKILKKGRDE